MDRQTFVYSMQGMCHVCCLWQVWSLDTLGEQVDAPAQLEPKPVGGMARLLRRNVAVGCAARNGLTQMRDVSCAPQRDDRVLVA